MYLMAFVSTMMMMMVASDLKFWLCVCVCAWGLCFLADSFLLNDEVPVRDYLRQYSRKNSDWDLLVDSRLHERSCM